MEYALRFTRVLMCLGYVGLMGMVGLTLFFCIMFYREVIVENGSLNPWYVKKFLEGMLLLVVPYTFAVFLAYMCTGRIALKPKDVR